MNQAPAPGTPSLSPRVEHGTRGVVPGIHLWPTLPTRGTHNTQSLHHPRTSQSTSTSGTQPQLPPRTMVPPQPPTVVREEPAPSVRPKQPILHGRPAHNSSSNNSSNTGLPQMADRDHNNHCSPLLHSIGQPHTPDHLQILQAGLHSHKGRVYC